MSTKISYLLAGILILALLTQCDSISSSNSTEELNEIPKVELESPADSTTEQTTEVELKWKKIKGGKQYRLQVGNDASFESMINDTLVEGTSFLTPQLERGNTYYWHVKPVKDNYNGPPLEWSDTWQFSIATDNNDETAIVELLSPEDGIELETSTVNFEWSKIADTTEYRYQLSSQQDFADLLENTLLNTPTIEITDLSYGQLYYWRVQVNNDGKSDNWSQVNNFSVVDTSADSTSTLPAPKQIAPGDGADNTSLQPTFEWEPVDGADYYILHSNRINPAEMVIETNVSGTTYTPSGLEAETTHDWRVRAVQNSVKGEWSSIWRFTTGSGDSGTPAVTLISPSDGATDQPTTLTLEWEALSGISDYRLQLATTTDFSSPNVDRIVSSTSEEVSGLSSGQQYYWRVQATGDGDTGNWSQVYGFTTESQTTSTVTLVSPSDGATGLSTSPTLHWEALSGISEYQVQVSSSSGFSSTVVDQPVTNTSYTASGLSNSQTYYWRVQANGDGDGSNWSAVRSFTTKSESGSTTGSRAGDEAALEALYAATNGSGWNNNSGWSSSGMSLANNIYGVTVATIDGELRVTRIDLKNNGLGGSIDFPEIGNLTEMTLFSVYLNNLDSYIPSELFECTKLEYLYLSLSDDVVPELATTLPHISVQSGAGSNHVGKTKGNENNVFHGTIPSNIDNLQNLKWFILNWTDYWADSDKVVNGSPTTVNGIQSIPSEIWNITTLENINIYENWNISGSGNSFSFPSTIGHIPNLEIIKLGGGSGTGWDEYSEGFMTGNYPSDMGQLNLLAFSVARNAQLSDMPDLSGSSQLETLSLRFSDFADGSPAVPDWAVDGSLTNIDAVDLAWPLGDKFTGQLPEFGTMNRLSYIDFREHNISGDLPASFWQSSDELRKNDFTGNSITGFGTDDLTDMAMNGFLNEMKFAYNEMSGRWPTLDWNNPPPLNWVELQENRFVFSDMLYVPYNAPNGETIFELYNNLNISRKWSYAPQKPFGQSRSVSYATGSDITLDDFEGVVTHPDNRYQWQKDGADISGATSRTLTISNAGSSDAGTYRLIVTNPGVSDLTLTSKPISISVE